MYTAALLSIRDPDVGSGHDHNLLVARTPSFG
jgi:hypothetical protein